MILQRDEAITAQAKLLEERYDAIEQQGRMIDERDHTIKQIEKQVSVLQSEVEKSIHLIAEYQAEKKQLENDYSSLEQHYNQTMSFICSNWYIRKKWDKYATPKGENK